MIQSRFGFNTHLRYLKEYTRLLEVCKALNPTVMVGYVDKDEHAGAIIDLQAELPETIIVSRVYTHDGDDPRLSNEGKYHLKPDDSRFWIAAPGDCLNRWGHLGKNGLVLNLLNEPSAYLGEAEITRLLTWLGEIIPLATERGIRLCVPNFGSEHPAAYDGLWDEQFNSVLKLLSGSMHYLGLHEYGPGGAGIGRIAAMVKRCQQMGIKPPRTILTEFGVDHQRGEEDKYRGYRTRRWTGGYYADWIAEKFQTVYKPLVESGVLVGVALFSWGNSGGWEDMDVEPDRAFQDALLAHHKAGRLSADKRATQPTPPVVIPVLPLTDDSRWKKKRASVVTLTEYPVVIRPTQNPGDTTPPVGTLASGEDFYVIEDEKFGAFVPVMIAPGRGMGWVKRESVNWLAIPEIPPLPNPPDIAGIYERIAEAYQHISASYSKLAEDYVKIADLYKRGVSGAAAS